eukprot:g6358.t1
MAPSDADFWRFLLGSHFDASQRKRPPGAVSSTCAACERRRRRPTRQEARASRGQRRICSLGTCLTAGSFSRVSMLIDGVAVWLQIPLLRLSAAACTIREAEGCALDFASLRVEQGRAVLLALLAEQRPG